MVDVYIKHIIQQLRTKHNKELQLMLAWRRIIEKTASFKAESYLQLTYRFSGALQLNILTILED